LGEDNLILKRGFSIAHRGKQILEFKNQIGKENKQMGNYYLQICGRDKQKAGGDKGQLS
jgi:hypothetical protein